jgi:hypothetical protein
MLALNKTVFRGMTGQLFWQPVAWCLNKTVLASRYQSDFLLASGEIRRKM